jgi:2-dehydropantoate 2-reductase
VHCPADRESPGRIRQRGPAEMIVPAGALGNSFAQLFSKTPVSVSSTADFKTELWKKLCINSAGAVHAILLKSVNIANHPGAAHVMRGIVLECIAVGRAEGAVLDDAMADTVVERATQAPAGSINSMHADRLAGRPMEIDARNGVIVRLGRKHGIPTPVNAVVVALLEAARDL